MNKITTVLAWHLALALALALAVLPPLALSAQQATATPRPAKASNAASAAELERYLAGLKSFEAQFRQTLHDSRGRVTEQADGRLYLEKPGRFRWEYREPNEQLIVSDGKNLWLFDVELEQVTVKPLDASLAMTPALLLAGQASVGESFTIEAAPAAGGMKWFALTPRRQDTDFTRLRLGFAGKDLRAMELEDKLQQRTLIVFSAVKRNPRLGSTLFAFVPPQGVDVIGTPQR